MIILVPLKVILTNTTKWKQNGITIYRQFYLDESPIDFDAMYIDDDDETIYITEKWNNRVIELKLNRTNVSVVASGNGTHSLLHPVDIIIDKKNDSIIICEEQYRISRWSRQNPRYIDTIVSNIPCRGIAMDDNGYLYTVNVDLFNNEVRRWYIGVKDKSTIVAGGNGFGNSLKQLGYANFIFVDKDYSVYVVDQSNHRVMKWIQNAKEGIVVAGGNDNGDNLTQLSDPLGIIVDHLGNVYVTDTYNHRVMRWINGAKEGSIVVGGNGPGNQTNQLNRPSDLLFDKQGNLYVLDTINRRIQKFFIEFN
jgi:hypothetical protein